MYLTVQILLLKPQLEKEAACISIWHRLVTTMVENVCNPPLAFEAENEGPYPIHESLPESPGKRIIN